MKERAYTEAQIAKGLKHWFYQSMLPMQIDNPDRYNYMPGIIQSIREAAGVGEDVEPYEISEEEFDQIDMFEDIKPQWKVGKLDA